MDKKSKAKASAKKTATPKKEPIVAVNDITGDESEEELIDDKTSIDENYPDDENEIFENDEIEEEDEEDEENDEDENDENEENENADESEEDEVEEDEDEDEDIIDKTKTKSWKKNNNNSNCAYDTETNNMTLTDLIDEVPKDDIIIVPNDQRITKPFLSKYEKVRMESIRAEQLSKGAKTTIKGDIEHLSPQQVAELEIIHKKCPLIVERPLPNNKIERWKISELQYLM